MWDYDKLFAQGNVICVGDIVSSVDEFSIMDWKDSYANKELTHKALPSGKIQYIIRLDGHGNVVEKLFDRERDIPKPMPELETGMFVRITDHGNMRNTILGYVDIQNCRVIYQDGTYSNLVPLYTKKSKVITDIVEVYSHKALCFNGCLSNEALIWRSPEYQAYLDSKSN